MSLIYKNLKKIDEYARAADILLVPPAVKKYDNKNDISTLVEIFKIPFFTTIGIINKDLKSIYDEEMPIIGYINYYMGQASLNIYLINVGVKSPGSFANAHSSLINIERYTVKIIDLFTAKTQVNTKFVASCQQSLIALERAINLVGDILKAGVSESDLKEVKNFQEVLIEYQSNFKFVHDANNSNGEIFDRIHDHVASMKTLSGAASNSFNSKDYAAALDTLDKFAEQKNDLVLVSEDIRPDA